MALAARPSNSPHLNIAFDCDEDVLYVSIGAPVPSHADESDKGLLLRWANDDNRPSGVTALDFRRNWQNARAAFYEAVAKHLLVPPETVAEAVQRAI